MSGGVAPTMIYTLFQAMITSVRNSGNGSWITIAYGSAEIVHRGYTIDGRLVKETRGKMH